MFEDDDSSKEWKKKNENEKLVNTQNLFRNLMSNQATDLYYSFCQDDVCDSGNDWHCAICRRCMDWRVWHCDKCNKCIYKDYNHCNKCSKCINNFIYIHCEKCDKCVDKNKFKHCNACGDCVLNHCKHCYMCNKCVYKTYKHCEKCNKCNNGCEHDYIFGRCDII